MTSRELRNRLAALPDCVELLLRDTRAEQWTRRPAADTWSAQENLAHLARYQHVFLHERVRRILAEEQPPLPRYRAADDPEWPHWREMTLEETLTELRTGRQALAERVMSCSDRDLARVGLHPAFGALALSDWLEFFLLHESHHLYIALTRARG